MRTLVEFTCYLDGAAHLAAVVEVVPHPPAGGAAGEGGAPSPSTAGRTADPAPSPTPTSASPAAGAAGTRWPALVLTPLDGCTAGLTVPAHALVRLGATDGELDVAYTGGALRLAYAPADNPHARDAAQLFQSFFDARQEGRLWEPHTGPPYALPSTGGAEVPLINAEHAAAVLRETWPLPTAACGGTWRATNGRCAPSRRW